LVVAGGVELEFVDGLAVGAGDADVEVLDEHEDFGAGVTAAEADVVESAPVAERELAEAVDDVMADSEYEPGIVTGHLRHARLPLDPHPGDYLVVGDDEVPPALAKVLSRESDGTLRLRILPGRPDHHEELRTRRSPDQAGAVGVGTFHANV
jgi:hypothetical protein